MRKRSGKNRFLALLLSVVMVVGLLSGAITVSAYDNTTDGVSADRAKLAYVYLGTSTGTGNTNNILSVNPGLEAQDIPADFAPTATTVIWIGLQLSNLSAVRDMLQSDRAVYTTAEEGGLYNIVGTIAYNSEYLQPAVTTAGPLYNAVKPNYMVYDTDNGEAVDSHYKCQQALGSASIQASIPNSESVLVGTGVKYFQINMGLDGDNVSYATDPRVFFDDPLSDPGAASGTLGDDPVMLIAFPFKLASGKAWTDVTAATAAGTLTTPLVQGVSGPSALKLNTGFGGENIVYNSWDKNRATSEAQNLKNYFDIVDLAGNPSDGVIPLTPGAEKTINYNANFPAEVTADPDTDFVLPGTAPTTFNMYDAIADLPTTATITGFPQWALTGWNTAADGTGTEITSTTVISSEGLLTDDVLELYAQWEQKFTMTFDGNGGTAGADSAIRYEFATSEGGKTLADVTQDKNGTTVTVPDGSTFTRDGYSFEGWYKAADGYYTVSDSAKVLNMGTQPIGSATYFVNWTSDDPDSQVTVTFDPNSGAFADSAATKTVSVDPGDCINPAPSTSTLAENMPMLPTRANYTFKEWNTAANGSGDVFNGQTAVSADTTVYAIWQLNEDTAPENTVTVNFVAGMEAHPPQTGVTVEIKQTSYTVYADVGGQATVDASIIPSITTDYMAADGKEYSFKGWEISEIDGTADTSNTAYEDGTALDAGKTYTVKATWGETKRVNLHLELGSFADAFKTASGQTSDVVEIKGVANEKLEDNANFQALLKTLNNDATEMNDSNLKGNYTFVAWGEQSRADANAAGSAVRYDTNEITLGEGAGEYYAYWALDLSVEANQDTAAQLRYTGSKLDWNDATNPAINIWYDKTSDGDPDGDGVFTYTAKANADLTDADYEVKFYDASAGTSSAPIDLKDAGQYRCLFETKRPADPENDGVIEAYEPIEFMNDEASITVGRMSVDITINSVSGKSNGKAPAEGSTSGAQIDFDVTDTSLDPAVVTEIEGGIAPKYYKASGPSVEGMYGSADVDTTTSMTDPYEVGTYIVVISADGSDNLSLGNVTFADDVNGYLLTTDDADSTHVKISEELKAALGLDDTHVAILYTVEISSRTVSFYIPAAMDDDPAAVELGTATDVTVQDGTSIDNAEENPDAEEPTVSKLDNWEMAGWFVVTGDTPSYADALTAYNTWKADETANAALKFTADTIVTDDMKVVAVRIKSTDATLKDDPGDPEDPNDDTKALQLVVLQIETAEGGEETTVDQKTVTEFKQSDFTTSQAFTPEDDSVEYYVRVENKFNKTRIEWNTAEAGSVVKVFKKAPTEENPENRIEIASYVVGALNPLAAGNKTVELDVARSASTNDFEIEVTAPDGTSAKTYQLHIQRLAQARIELAYGNSPYGMIMRSEVITDKAAAKDAFLASDTETAGDDNRARNLNLHFTDGFTPTDMIDATMSADTWYTTVAWAGVKDKEGAAVNYDLNDYAVFAYTGESFVDPGFTVYDEEGNDVTATGSITVSDIENVAVLESAGPPSFRETTTTTLTRGENGTYTMNGLVRTGVYYITYRFTYTPIGATDSVTVEIERPVILLNRVFDTKYDDTVYIDSDDSTGLKNNWSTWAGMETESDISIFLYRVCDTKKDTNPYIDSDDSTELKNSWSNPDKQIQYYKSFAPAI